LVPSTASLQTAPGQSRQWRQLHREQHFRTRHTRLTCTVSPLFDAAGRLAGVLDISSFRPDPTGAVLPLALAATRDAARRIEARCFRETYAKALIISLPETGEGVSVRRPGHARRRRIQHLQRRRAGRPAHPVGCCRRSGRAGGGERAVLAGALAAMQGNVSAAAKALGISRATMHRKIRTLGLQARRPTDRRGEGRQGRLPSSERPAGQG
jgi:transcriptional regulator of acetoin/glycerol metabolism